MPKTGKESKYLINICLFVFLFLFYFLGTKPPSPLIQQEQEKQQQEEEQEEDQQQEQQPETRMILPPISHEHVINHPPTTDKSTIPKRARQPTYSNMSRWNTSTHVKPNSYVPDLPDAYPRDPFTKMPPKRDAIEVYRLLQSIYDILEKTMSYFYSLII